MTNYMGILAKEQGSVIIHIPLPFLGCPKWGFTHLFRAYCSISGWDLVKQKMQVIPAPLSPSAHNSDLQRCPLPHICDTIATSKTTESHWHFSSLTPARISCLCMQSKSTSEIHLQKRKQADPQPHGAGFGDEGGRDCFSD